MIGRLWACVMQAFTFKKLNGLVALRNLHRIALIVGFVISINACVLKNPFTRQESLFSLLDSTTTGIRFANNVPYTDTLNVYTFRNFYNGGGVGAGDINNDGLPDLFFCGNLSSNKLYINKGNFQFEDITEKSGLATADIWSTGVTFADINGDGLLDIYICKSGDFTTQHRSNALYINNGNLTFTESAAKYGLDNLGLSTHAVFFDYDRDGDLDCYLLNNSFKSVGNFDLIKDQRKISDSLGGNKLYRNDNGHFKDVTAIAGIYSSKIGFGLGVTIADVNKDGWPDMYISNDFFERDYLYINNKNGSFTEQIETSIHELSLNAMGADIADMNNDGFPDIYVTDMFPDIESRVKSKANFEKWDKYQANLQAGYYHQFVRNTLQLNNGRNSFSEIGRLAGTDATDWSWGALITDFNNDGLKDIFVANGIYKDLTDQDYIQYTANPDEIRKILSNNRTSGIKTLIDLMPSNALSNYAYSNNGDLTFTNKALEWGLATPSFSNGSSYVDLDNDGDLDLVVNNVNMPAFVYRNNSVQQHPENKFLKVSLEGVGMNRFGIGAKVTVYYDHTLSYQEAMPMRGFESTVDNRLNFGLGKATKIDSVKVEWTDDKVQVLLNVGLNQQIVVKQTDAVKRTKIVETPVKTLFTASASNEGIDFVHKENEYSDFNRDKITFHMLSTAGPSMTKGDVNGDGLEDFYIGGAMDQAGALYIQNAAGKFKRSNEKLWEADKGSEDVDAVFFDADGDGDQDLFVCSGGSEFSVNSTELISRLYFNDGKGNFTKSTQLLPSSSVFESASCVSAADYDKDGDIDLFLGVRLKIGQYGYSAKSYLLENNGKGVFADVTQKVAPAFLQAGMVTDAKWFDYDRDGRMDLVMAGEYMPIRIFHNTNKGFEEITKAAGLDNSNGWWNRLEIADVNGDGYADIVAGNHGLNSRFKASVEKPVCMYVSDFDENGTSEQVITTYNGKEAYPLALRHDIVEVLPYLKKKYLKYESYKEQKIEDVFTKGQLAKTTKLEAKELRSSVIMNKGNGTFSIKALPTEAQFSPVYGVAVSDYDGDGKQDILLGGNFYESKPEVGIYDASYGMLLKGDGKGNFTKVPEKQSGIVIKGAVRGILGIKVGKKNVFLVSKNNEAPVFIIQN